MTSDNEPGLMPNERDALERLLRIALGGTGQSAIVANFLLAWWNAADFGGFNLTDLWAVDTAISDDMLLIVAFLARRSMYPDNIQCEDGTELSYNREFVALVNQWRSP